MFSSPIPDSCILLSIAQFRILRFVYQANHQRPQIFMLTKRHTSWEVLAAYRLLSRRVITLPSGKPCIEYRLSKSGRQLMKSLEV